MNECLKLFNYKPKYDVLRQNFNCNEDLSNWNLCQCYPTFATLRAMKLILKPRATPVGLSSKSPNKINFIEHYKLNCGSTTLGLRLKTLCKFNASLMLELCSRSSMFS